MKNFVSSSFFTALLGAASITSTFAADLTWRGSTANWYTNGAWLSGASNANFAQNDNVSFTDGGVTQPTLSSLSSPTTVGTFAASNTTGTYTISTTGTNTLTGTTLTKSNAGTLTFNQTGAVTFSNTALQGGTLLIRQTAFNGGAITVSGDTALGAASTASATTTLNGTSLLGSAVLTISPQSATIPFALSGTLNTSAFTGTISASADGQLNIGSSSANLAQAKIVLSGNTRFQSSSSGIVSLGQITTTGSGNILGRSVGTGVTTTFEIGALNTASSIEGSIQNDGLQTNQTAAVGIVALNKVGIGTLTLSGTNTYSGATAVSAGTLLANATGTSGTSSATGTGTVTVNNSGSLLGGTGAVQGAVTINGASRLTGATNGTVGALTLRSGLTLAGTANNLASYVVDLSGATADLLSITGNLSLATTFDKFALQIASGPTAQRYTVVTYSGTLTGIFDDLSSLPVGYSLDYSIPNRIDLVTAVPEPSTVLGGCMLLCAAGWRERRRLAAARLPFRLFRARR